MEADLQKRMKRIGEIVEQFESSADPRTQASARELLESLMALHGAGLERILEIASRAGEAGQVLLAKCAQDDLVSGLLLLYGLHPEDLRTRVQRALDKSKKSLESHSASAELVSIGEDGTITVRLHTKASGGCGSSTSIARGTLEAALQDAAPDAAAIEIQETATPAGGFVSVAQLAGGQGTFVSLADRAARSGN